MAALQGALESGAPCVQAARVPGGVTSAVVNRSAEVRADRLAIGVDQLAIAAGAGAWSTVCCMVSSSRLWRGDGI